MLSQSSRIALHWAAETGGGGGPGTMSSGPGACGRPGDPPQAETSAHRTAAAYNRVCTMGRPLLRKLARYSPRGLRVQRGGDGRCFGDELAALVDLQAVRTPPDRIDHVACLQQH